MLRTHSLGYELVQLLVDLLPDEKWGRDAGHAFQIITSEDDLLNKPNHIVTRLLHKQRFFMFVFPKLVGTASSHNEDSGSIIEITANESRKIKFPHRFIKHNREYSERDTSS